MKILLDACVMISLVLMANIVVSAGGSLIVSKQVAQAEPFAGDFAAARTFARQGLERRKDLHASADDLHVVAGLVRLFQVGGDEQERALEVSSEQRRRAAGDRCCLCRYAAQLRGPVAAR